jgi:hypothetical protein
MLAVLANRTYRHLFLAQLIALIGTGLATVALGLLAFDLAAADAGAVLGTALAIKMVAYVAPCWWHSIWCGPQSLFCCPSSARSGRSMS